MGNSSCRLAQSKKTARARRFQSGSWSSGCLASHGFQASFEVGFEGLAGSHDSLLPALPSSLVMGWTSRQSSRVQGIEVAAQV